MNFRHLVTLDPATGRARHSRVPMRALMREILRSAAAAAPGDRSGPWPALVDGAFDRIGGHLVASFGEGGSRPTVQHRRQPHVWIDGVVYPGDEVEAQATGPTGRLGLTVRRFRLTVAGVTVLDTRYVPGRILARLPGLDEWGIGGDDFDFGRAFARWYGAREGAGETGDAVRSGT